MKSSAAKLLVVFAIIFFPLIIWAMTTQSQDIRSRANDDSSLTPTATPSATLAPTATPSATLAPSPTPTNSPPICLGLSANPGAGPKPLTVNFACAGWDGNNDIVAAEFGFGGSQKQTVQKNIGQYGSITTTYTYTTPGSYNVTCHVQDNNNTFSNYPSYCTYTVIVTDNALTPTPIRTPAPTLAVTSIGYAPGAGPVILNGGIPTLAPSPSIIPTVITPTPAPSPGWWTNDKIHQLLIMLIVSGITIAVALSLHAYFDRR